MKFAQAQRSAPTSRLIALQASHVGAWTVAAEATEAPSACPAFTTIFVQN